MVYKLNYKMKNPLAFLGKIMKELALIYVASYIAYVLSVIVVYFVAPSQLEVGYSLTSYFQMGLVVSIESLILFAIAYYLLKSFKLLDLELYFVLIAVIISIFVDTVSYGYLNSIFFGSFRSFKPWLPWVYAIVLYAAILYLMVPIQRKLNSLNKKSSK